MTEKYNKKHMLQNSELLQEYLPIAIFFGIAVLVSGLIMILLTYYRQKYNKDKLEPYECGFEPLAMQDQNLTYVLLSCYFIYYL